MAQQWFYAKGDERHGPVSTAQLKELAASGGLVSSDLVWRDGLSEWMPARRIHGLFPAQVGPPPMPGRSSPPHPPTFTTAAQERGEGFEEAERVGFGPRLGAFLIDSGISLVVILVFGTAGALIAVSEAGNPIEREAFATRGFMIGAGLAGILYGLWEGITGAAAGKLAMRLMIAGDGGMPAPTEVLMKRFLIKNGAEVLMVVAAVTGNEPLSGIGGLWSLAVVVGCFLVLGERRQAFHDMIAHTAVYRKADVAQVAPPSAAPGGSGTHAHRRRTSGHRR